MRRKFTLVIIGIAVILTASVSTVFTNPEQPPAGRTGCSLPPVELTCGTATCHGNLNTGPGNVAITFSDPNSKYAVGQTYDVTVTSTESGKVKFGFEVTVVDAAGDPIGTLLIPGGSTTITSPPGGVGGRDYLGHKNASAVNSWTFQWTAPSTNAGNISFFAAGNCANGNGSESGDNIYTTSLQISPDFGAGVFSTSGNESGFSILSLGGNALTVQFEAPAAQDVTISLYDLQGQRIQMLLAETVAPGLQQHTFYLNAQIVSGVYLLAYESPGQNTARKIFISK